MVKKRRFNGKEFGFRVESKDRVYLEHNKKYLQKHGSQVRITVARRKKPLTNKIGVYGHLAGKVYILWSRKNGRK